MNFENIVKLWFSKLEKGYALPPYSKEEIQVLESIIPNNKLLNESNFNDIIKNYLVSINQIGNDDPVPLPQGRYPLPSGAGKFDIKVDERDKAIFKTLFKLAPDKNTGNGEVALYWLFSRSNKVSSDRVGAGADLTINGISCEVKSYDSHNKQITLGKFKDFKDTRKIIASVFGLLNLTKAFNETADKQFYTETGFNIDDLKQGFDKLLKLKTEVFDNVDLRAVLDSVTAFKQMRFEIENVIKQLGDQNTAEGLAKATFSKLLTEKFNVKPGPGGYIINLLPSDPTNIKAYYIPNNIEDYLSNKDYNELRQSTAVSSSEIKINYSKLFE